MPLASPGHQAEFVAEEIAAMQNDKVLWSEMSVLFRARYQSAELELELTKRNIPYFVRGGIRFFEQSHVKDIFAFLYILSNFKNEIAWQRILRHQEGIGQIYAERIFKQIKECDDIKDIFTKDLNVPKRSFSGVKNIFKIIKDIHTIGQEKQEKFISKIIKRVSAKWHKNFLESSYDNSQERIEDIKQLTSLTSNYLDLDKMLSEFSLTEEFKGEDSCKQNIVLSTIHQAKGLEWNTVFIISLKDGEFPYSKCLNDIKLLEEERRLFYVATTRCKEKLYLTYPLNSWSWRETVSTEPSMFIREIDKGLISHLEQDLLGEINLDVI